MPTIFTHALVPLALGAGLGSRVVPPRLVAAGMALAVLPDLDVVAFQLGVPYGSSLGHRGFSHALPVAALCAAAGAACSRRLGSTPLTTFLFLFFAMASHGLLDACTNGGSGIALLWPFTDARYFAPFTPIEVSPIGLARFLSARGAAVMASELLWVWLPCIVLALALLAARRFQSRSSSSTG